MKEMMLTFDVDWAPDNVIEYVANILIESNIPSTWFVTHPSKAITHLQKRPDLFEFGIHPNLLKGSTQGKDLKEVVAYLLRIVPDAKIVRMHGLHQSTYVLKELCTSFGIKVDMSLFLPYAANIHQHTLHLSKQKEGKLLRIPYYWEDDFEMYSKTTNWTIKKLPNFNSAGLKIFNFHPIHVFLNTEDFQRYENVKKYFSKPEMLAKSINTAKKGSGTFLVELIELIKKQKLKLRRADSFIERT